MSTLPPGMLIRLINNKEDIIKNYTLLLSLSPTESSSIMIQGILNDEKAHLALFINLYNGLFGELPPLYGGTAQNISSYSDGLNIAVNSEFSTYEAYGGIVFADSDDSVRSIFKKALFDENIHSVKFTFLKQELSS